ncbi:undecaprenyl-diphosphatase UppP [Gaiella sp.]|uniref:undecaprenyl-diphosphatase UppP n=1 Tax=Gaiella sp. TaxID=2663207 RepID=UPI003267E501
MRRTVVYGSAAALITIAVVLTLLGWGENASTFPDSQALVLGFVQGFTELLPISSSGHLILVPWLGDWTYLKEHEEFNKTFDVALHLGTLVAVVAYFWSDLIGYLVAWVRSIRRRSIETQNERIAWLIVVATIPAAIIGAAGQSVIETHLGEPWQIAILLGVFALVLYWADRRPERKDVGDIGLKQGLLIGLAQSLALAPGVSRSGITISAGRLLGLTRDAAARLSFLLLVPIVLGAVVLKGYTDVIKGELPEGWVGPFVVGTIASAGSGLLAISWLLGYVRRHDYSVFVVYRLALTVFILVVIATGVRDAAF